MEQLQKRQVAYKIKIKDIQENLLIQQEGWLPNYIEFGNKQVSRVNISGIIINKASDLNNDHIIIDDGENTITIRKFEGQDIFLKDYNVGELINIIGRVREFSQEKYIMPEIIKKITNPLWITFQKKEIEYLTKTKFYEDNQTNLNSKKDTTIVEEIVQEKPKKIEEVMSKIKELDVGEGTNIESIIDFFGPSAEKMIQTLLEQGNIFETRPGRIKVLE